MRWKVVLSIGVTLMLFGAALSLNEARRSAARMNAQGRLSQLHLALLNYQTVHGVLPDRSVTDPSGRPLCSWVAMVLPYIEQHEVADAINLSHRWDSPLNADSLARGEGFWNWYTKDGFFISAFDGDGSVWDASGVPRGRLSDGANSVLLIAVPLDGVHPLEPFSLSEDHLRELLESGKEAIYVDAGRFHGTVKLDEKSLIFDRGMVR